MGGGHFVDSITNGMANSEIHLALLLLFLLRWRSGGCLLLSGFRENLLTKPSLTHKSNISRTSFSDFLLDR